VAAETELQFDGWVVNRLSGEMTRAGRASRLPQQPLRILIELFDHAGEIVTREQLVKVLWPQGIVDFDNGLNVAVRRLRVALDDVGDVPKYIETLPKVGYRFIVKPGAAAGGPVYEAATGMSRRAQLGLGWGLAALAVAIGAAWWWSTLGPPGPNGAETRQKHVPSVRAREYYLEGLHHRSRRDIKSGALARASFEAALREDPQYAQAWAAIGEGYSVQVLLYMMPPAEGLPKARAAAQRAIELDPDLIEGHNLLGQIYMDHDKDFAAAERQYQRALALNGGAARVWHYHSMLYGQTGRLEQAFAAIRRARELEPMTLLYAGNYGMLLYMTRRYDEAVEFMEPLVEANPKFDHARSVLARALLASGQVDRALEQLEARAEAGLYQGDLGVVYAKLERREDALREVARLEQRVAEGYRLAYEIASIYIALGDLDKGCEWLARSIDDHSPLASWLKLDPRMDPLRGRQCYTEAENRLFGAGTGNRDNSATPGSR
jgi:DNA-binding winged helix-turn-helix (wHTH) protein/tetratricopeptide (TPR) repeat protein